jgi:CSLREA domain-containing protein
LTLAACPRDNARLLLEALMRTLPIGLLAVACALAAGPAGAATFVVDSTADAVDASPGEGVCATDLGDCTLRAAVMETNALAGEDHIDLPAGIYTLAIPGDAENDSASGDLDVVDELTIQGDAMNETVIDAAGLDRGIDVIFHLPADDETPNGVTIRDLTVRGGFVGQTSDDFGNGGGGIRGHVENFYSHLTLDRVAVRDNFATWGGGGLSCGGQGTCRMNDGVVSGNETAGWGGGGILGPYFSTVSIDGTEITGNIARHGAGILKAEFGNLEVRNARIATNVGDSALFVEGVVSVTDSVLENNQATGIVNGITHTLLIARTTIRGNVGANGGGAHLTFTETGARIHDSAIYDNESLGDGGGILIGPNPLLELRNTTVSGNRAAGVGGGIAAFAGFDLIRRYGVSLDQMTITRNYAPHGAGIWFGPASPGIYSSANSIVAQNHGGDCGVSGDSVQVMSGGYNLIGDASGCDWTPAAGDQFGTAAAPIEAMLGPLSWWSGPTLMHAPLPGSPAIDAGNPAAPSETGPACRTTDQRGVARPIDGDGVGGARCDIGAMEAPWPRPTACGLGAELVLVLGALRAWSHRRA